MKTGPVPQPMAERLQASLNAQAEQGAASIKRTLKNFETDLATSLHSAQATIESDMADYRTELSNAHETWVEEIKANIALSRRITKFGPMLICLLVAIFLWITAALTWTMSFIYSQSIMQMSLSQRGFSEFQTETGIIYTWDQKRLTLTTCTGGTTTVPCLTQKQK